MSYSGAAQAKQAREILGRALAILQVDPSLPPDAQEVASFMAQSVGSLFAAEYSPDDTAGLAAVRASLGLLGQALAKMQTIVPPVAAIENAMGTLAQAMGILFPLTMAVPAPAPQPVAAQPAPQPMAAQPAPQPVMAQQPAPQPVQMPAQAAPQFVAQAPVPVQPILQQPVVEQPASPAATSKKSTVLFGEIPAAAVQQLTQQAVAQPAQQPQPVPQTVAAQPAPEPSSFAQQPAQPAFQATPAALQPSPMPAQVAPGQPAQGFGAPVAQPVWHETVPTPAPHVVPAALLAAAEPKQISFESPAAPAAHAQTQPAPAPQPAHQPAAQPAAAQPAPAPYKPGAPVSVDGRKVVEANIGVRTESNFWVGFEDEIAQGGVFMTTYEDIAPGTPVALRVTLPQGATFTTAARVRFLRDAVEVGEVTPPGIGFVFDSLGPDHRELAQKFMRQRRPLFYDVG